MWGDPHPWELAELKHGEWLAVLRHTIKRWTTSATVLSDFFEKGGPLTLERWRAMKREHDEAQDEHRAVMRGERETCWRIWEELDPPLSDKP